MKRLVFSFVMSVAMILAFGLAMIPLIQFAEGFEELVHSHGNFFIEMNFLPMAPLLILSVIERIDFYIGKKKKKRPSFWMYPLVTPSDDERERTITAKASYDAFRTIWIVSPFCAGLMIFYPVVRDLFPAYPVFILLIIPLVQVTVYYFKVRNIYCS